jgi:hypothetical protein
MMPKSKVKDNVLNLSDKVRVLDVLKDGMCLVEGGQCYAKMIQALNSTHPALVQVLLNGISLEPETC